MHQTVDRDGAEFLPVDARIEDRRDAQPLEKGAAQRQLRGIGQEFCLLLITSFEITS